MQTSPEAAINHPESEFTYALHLLPFRSKGILSRPNSCVNRVIRSLLRLPRLCHPEHAAHGAPSPSTAGVRCVREAEYLLCEVPFGVIRTTIDSLWTSFAMQSILFLHYFSLRMRSSRGLPELRSFFPAFPGFPHCHPVHSGRINMRNRLILLLWKGVLKR